MFYIFYMKIKHLKQITLFAIALATSAFAQGKAIEHQADSLVSPKTFENFNKFQIEKWGPITYSGAGKCDILDLYQKNVARGQGYSTVVDYHYKQTKHNYDYTCEAWGLGLAFKVTPDTNIYSQNLMLPDNRSSAFSARSQDIIRKLFHSDSAFLEVESIMPVTYQSIGECHTIDFLFNIANEQSNFHGIIDIKYDESIIAGERVCTFWGLGVRYKRRDVIEKEIVKKRIVEVIKAPPPKPDTIFVPIPSPTAPIPAPKKTCCNTCCCCDN